MKQLYLLSESFNTGRGSKKFKAFKNERKMGRQK